MMSLESLCARFTRDEGLPFADVLTEASILDVLNEHGVTYRDRVFSPVTTIWGFLSQVLSDDHSCRDAVSRIIAHRAANGIRVCSPNTASYCNARGRLHTGVFRTLAKQTAKELQTRVPHEWKWNGRSGVHRRRVARLHAGHAGEPSGLPATDGPAAGARLSAGPSRRAAVAGDWRLPRSGHRPVRGQGHRRDDAACERMYDSLCPGDVLLADALFDNYFLALRIAVARRYRPRRSRADASGWEAETVESRPDGDIIVWQRPNKPRGMTGEQYRRYPKSLLHAPGGR